MPDNTSFGYGKFLEMRAAGEWDILNEDDPIANVAHRVTDLIYDTEDLFSDVVKITLREMELPQDTGIGGDLSDKDDWQRLQVEKYGREEAERRWAANESAYLTEDDPRFRLYWEILNQAWSQIFAQVIASQKFRWTPEAMRVRLANKEKWNG